MVFVCTCVCLWQANSSFTFYHTCVFTQGICGRWPPVVPAHKAAVMHPLFSQAIRRNAPYQPHRKPPACPSPRPTQRIGRGCRRAHGGTRAQQSQTGSRNHRLCNSGDNYGAGMKLKLSHECKATHIDLCDVINDLSFTGGHRRAAHATPERDFPARQHVTLVWPDLQGFPVCALTSIQTQLHALRLRTGFQGVESHKPEGGQVHF